MAPFIPGSHYAFAAAIPDSDTSHIERKLFDLAYASVSPAQKLDIYWPAEGNGPFPVIVAIHGGAFMGGDKRDEQLTPMLEALNHGYMVASINYRMSGEALFPALVHDVKAAIRWLRANADAFLVDPVRIACWGGSAGGYLSLMAGVSGEAPLLDDLALGNDAHSSRIQALVDWFGPTDFLQMDAQLAAADMAPDAPFAHSAANSPESLILGGTITEIPDLVRAASPLTYLSTAAPPMLIQHGDRDDTVPCQQSVVFAAAARELLGEANVTLELLPGACHADPEFGSARNVEKVLEFLGRTLGL